MQAVVREKNQYFLRFDRGEDVIAGLADFASSERTTGFFSAIGAADYALLSWYNRAAKRYEDKEFKKEFEIATLQGNIAVKGYDYRVHAHGVFADRKCATYGGHVKKLIVSVTCEVAFRAFSKEARRAPFPNVGLDLLN